MFINYINILAKRIITTELPINKLKYPDHKTTIYLVVKIFLQSIVINLVAKIFLQSIAVNLVAKIFLQLVRINFKV
jgi:hypothetical protein